MKFRSRVAAFTAAAGLAAGLLIVGAGGAAHAASKTFLDCDQVSGTVKFSPGLTTAETPQTASFASPKAPTAGQYPRTCTGDLAAATGPLVSVKAKLAGLGSCNPPPATPTADPTDGKLDFTWTNIVLGKQLKSSTYIRLGVGATADTAGISNGIVTKGPGLGMNLEGGLLQAPVVTKNAPLGSVYSSLDANGNIVFGQSSQDLGLACVTNAPFGTPAQVGPFTELIFSTDGQSVLPPNPTVNGSLSFVLP